MLIKVTQLDYVSRRVLMEKTNFLKAIQTLRTTSGKRKFDQTFDIVINLKGLDLKKEADRILLFALLPFTRGKKLKIGAFVDKELSTKARESCDKVVLKDEFKNYDETTIRTLLRDVDIFIAQANIMPQVAMTFGKILGPVGKMPNPKAGCVVPPTAELKQLTERLQKTVRLETKNELSVKAPVGTEKMKDDEIAENMLTIYNSVLHAVPGEKEGIREVLVKLTMSKPVQVVEEKANG